MESDNCFLYLIKINKKYIESLLRVKRKSTIKQMLERKIHIPLQIDSVIDTAPPPDNKEIH